MKARRGRQDQPSVMSPVLLRAAGALALTGAAVMVIAAVGRLDAGAPPQAALQAVKRDQGTEAAASKTSARLISPAEPSQAAGDLQPPSAESGPRRLAAADAVAAIGAEAVPDFVDPALLAAAAKRASELTGAVHGRTSAPPEAVEPDEPVAGAPQIGEASGPADPASRRADAPAEAPSGEAAETTALLVAPAIPQARPEAPPAQRQADRRSTRAARARAPSDPPPECGKKRARWLYVNDVPTWFCR